MIDKRNTIITIVFLIILAIVPMSIMVKNFVSEEETIDNEDNSVVEYSTYSEQVDALVKNEVNGFVEANNYKGLMMRINNIFSKTVSCGKYIDSDQVLVGKNDWLFYKVKSDGSPIDDYMGTNHFTGDQLNAAKTNIEKARDYVESTGRKFYVLTIPDKEEVYSEYLPDTVPRLSDYTRLDQFSHYMMESSSVAYLDTTDVLMKYKDDYPLYFKTDTHWTYEGAFVALQEFFRVNYGECQTIDQVNFANMGGRDGDLSTVSKLNDVFTDTDYALEVGSVDQSLKRDETVFIVGDSFGEMIKPIAKEYYKQAHWIRVENFSMALLDQYDADVVIWESVERYLDKFEIYDITVK